jgi:3-phenylpropionate/cinnamic acid dioxygenase small subunit
VDFDDYQGVVRTLEDYNRFHDERRGSDWVGLFADDAVFIVHERPYHGHEGLQTFVDERRNGIGKHFNGIPLIQPLGPDTCRVELDYVGFRKENDGAMYVGGTGRYYDVLRRDADRWRFVERRIVGELRETGEPLERSQEG